MYCMWYIPFFIFIADMQAYPKKKGLALPSFSDVISSLFPWNVCANDALSTRIWHDRFGQQVSLVLPLLAPQLCSGLTVLLLCPDSGGLARHGGCSPSQLTQACTLHSSFWETKHLRISPATNFQMLSKFSPKGFSNIFLHTRTGVFAMRFSASWYTNRWFFIPVLFKSRFTRLAARQQTN
jgi:hypothetical protein